MADQVILADRTVDSEGVLRDISGQNTVGAIDLRGSPACSMTANSTAGISRAVTRPIGRTEAAQGTKIVTCPRYSVNNSSAKMPPTGPPAGTPRR